MKYVYTGYKKIPFISLIALWSISLVVNLPGLAISPLLSDLDKIFPHASQLEIQLLTVLPNLFIIPFVLLSGKLSVSKDKTYLVVIGLVIYLLSGIAYFFARSMPSLIIISCFLGIGCGIVIPLAAGMLAQYFTGKYRMKQLGIKSGIANFCLIFATFVVGWLGQKNWHLPFIVYLVPIIPIILTKFFSKKYIDKEEIVAEEERDKNKIIEPNYNLEISKKIQTRRIIGLMLFYFIITYSSIVISYYLPFRMQDAKMSSTDIGIMTSLFFLAITVPGFCLSAMVKCFKKMTIIISFIMMLTGLLFICFFFKNVMIGIGCLLVGWGYGILQPLIYDKTTHICNSEARISEYLSYILSMNYFAIVCAPFIVDFIEIIIGNKAPIIPFIINSIIVAGILLVSIFGIKSFAFSINEDYYKE